jgi:hypothetical protein
MARRRIDDEGRWARQWIRDVIDRCPRRLGGSDSERRAQAMIRAELERRDLRTDTLPFDFPANLYAAMGLHFAVGSAGSLLFGSAPAAALVLHLLAGTSYVLDSERKAYVLRRVLPNRRSQNLLATRSASGRVRRRIVLVAHADAAYTGLVFHPRMVGLTDKEAMPAPLGILERPMALATACQFALAGVDLLGIAMGPARRLLWPLVAGLSIPNAIGLGLNLDVVLRDRVVPGANDNLTGCAALILLADRLAEGLADDVELVFAVSGNEESGTAGAYRMVQQMRASWDAETTVVLAIDGLTNGALRYFEEGEVFVHPVPRGLDEAVQRTARSEARFDGVTRFHITAGATDAMPFLAAGYDAVGLGCVDPALGMPRHYHHPDDTPENLDLDQFVESVDFIEALVRDLAAEGAPGR